MILSMAMEDGLILKNPLNSKRLRVTGSPSEFTKVYTVEQMRFLVQNLDKVKDPADQTYLAIQALHPLRLEEVLGLKWEDIDFDNAVIHIRRAVTHPTRNQPEVKLPKTEASIRDIGLSSIAAKYLTPGKSSDFVFGGKTPLSYQRVKRMCNRIRVDTDFSERITPQRFRTTVLTDIYDATKDVKAAQAAAGHTTSAMTLKHYVKGRTNCTQTAAALDHVYCS
jgi:integrase